MNRLSVRRVPAPFGPGTVVAWWVDDQPLEDLLVADGFEYAERSVLPFDGLHDDHEAYLVWTLAVPAEGETTVLPVTTCESDRDLDCCCYAVVVSRAHGKITWSRAGRTDFDERHVSIDAWEPRFRGLCFTEENYLAALEEARRLAAPESELPEGHPGFRVGSRWRVRDTLYLKTHTGPSPQATVPAGATLRVVDTLDWERPPWAWAVLDDGSRFEPCRVFPDVPDDARVFVGPVDAKRLEPLG